MVVGRVQAWSFADRAGDVFDTPALDALHVVVVVELVLHFVEGATRIRKIHPADDARAGEVVQDAVHRGQCHAAEVGRKGGVHELGRRVRIRNQRLQYSDTLHCHAKPGRTQLLGCRCCGLHASIIALF